MYPDQTSVAILFCVITMLGWGSWANTLKLSGKDRWPFELYYWDYAVGVLVFSILAVVFFGGAERSADELRRTFLYFGGQAFWTAFLSGAVFNASNILLVVAIDAAGMSVAFPVGVGLALVIGTILSYLQQPHGNPQLLFAGVASIVAAMALSARAYATIPAQGQAREPWAVGYAILAGCLMGSFYPQLIRAVAPAASLGSAADGLLNPYTALFVFAGGLFASNFVFNSVFMARKKLGYDDYFRGTLRLHSLGTLGGFIWMVALLLNVLASGAAGPAISYALGQGATLVAAMWGVFVWKEFRDAPPRTYRLIALMFATYVTGIILIGLATL
jgi:glucose uptake protein